MENLKKFMVVHHEPDVRWATVEANWGKLAMVESAKWSRTYFNRKAGSRYCVWLASDEKKLKQIFSDLRINWESILEVEETVPDIWGKDWEKHLAAEKKADTLGF